MSSSPGISDAVGRKAGIANWMPIRRHVYVSPRRWLYMRITIKPREFDGGAMLAFEAAERGWGVIFGKDIYFGDAFPRGVLFEKGVMPGRAAKSAIP